MKKSCKNDEESGKKMQKIRCKIQEKKSSDYRHHSKLQRNVTEKSDKK